MQNNSTQTVFSFQEDNTIIKQEENQRIDTSSTFTNNMSLPIHRWFRYSAGFSAIWVRKLIEKEKENGRSKIFDPFAGSGTVLLESEYCDVEGKGTETHPFVSRISQAKLQWREDPNEFRNFALSILAGAKNVDSNIDDYPKLIKQCYPNDILFRLDKLKISWQKKNDSSPISELTWLALTSILRTCAPVGTAQWQYVLPKKSKVNVIDPYVAFENKINLMVEDMRIQHRHVQGPKSTLYQEDARCCPSIKDGWADLVITSPPYANNYDYADATRLEMSFWGEIQNWGDLQNVVRKYLVRSCTQHVSKEKEDLNEILEHVLLSPIREEIIEVCSNLSSEREKHGGKKQYHKMVASYFLDLAQVWVSLRRITTSDSLVCFVIGDSAPYGIYVPVDKWLGELAISAGFKSFDFEKTRDRNIKWKNRKHNVPLHEGRLWIEG